MNQYKEVKEYIDKCKKKTKKIIFTHGVYDLFHTGHLHSLRKSKELGDILVVGVDSDWLVKIVKGNSRPVISENERLEIIRSIKFVDYAFILDTRSEDGDERLKFFVELYKYVKPDVVTVGKNEWWFETQKKLCEQAGIKLVETGQINGSTTDILKKIVKTSSVL